MILFGQKPVGEVTYASNDGVPTLMQKWQDKK